MNRRIILSLLVALFCMTGLANAGEVVVIVNLASAITEATADEISKLYRGKASSISDAKAEPVDQDASSAVRSDFSEKMLGRSVSKVTEYWKKKVFAGKGTPPDAVANDAAVIEYVKKNPGAVGYIGAGSLTDDVRAVTVDGKVKW